MSDDYLLGVVTARCERLFGALPVAISKCENSCGERCVRVAVPRDMGNTMIGGDEFSVALTFNRVARAAWRVIAEVEEHARTIAARRRRVLATRGA